MPVDSYMEKTRRYCFIEYNTTQEVELAKEKSHGYKLGKEYIAVNLLDDFDRKTYNNGLLTKNAIILLFVLFLAPRCYGMRRAMLFMIIGEREFRKRYKLKLMSIVIVNMVKVTLDHHEEVIKVGISPSLKESESFKKFLYVIAGCPGDVRFLMSVDVVGLRCQHGVNRE
ncbi:hypothetical protein IFM89_012477 [Coptis chinensis]|uniref:RRM domain-containing protein n=1 Tax=Coptis chinensis TaxID=261450 RepID=A0A835LXV3_9MAGN|nr:hypothetical protein IFM89_012477 [Coptis chinensis]